MKRSVLYLTVMILVTGSGCLDIFFGGVHGSGVEATETRETAVFTSVELTGSPDVFVKIGTPRSVRVTADDNIIGLIDTVVSGSTLQIKSKKNYSSRTGVKVEITVEQLENATVTGSGDMTVSGVQNVRISARVTGSGDLDITGSSEEVDAAVTGSGSIDLRDLQAQRATATVTGSGDIDITATQSLDGTVFGSGDIRYYGSPQSVATNVTGSGDIIPR